MESKKLEELYEKRETITKKLKKVCYDCNPKRRKSEFITCSNCGSRYPRKYIYEPDGRFSWCCVCKNKRSLYSATSIKRIENWQRKLEENRKLIDEENERLEQLAHPNQSKFERSLNQVYNEVEDIFEEYDFGDTYEIYGEIGGDAVHYVIMKDDGAVYEK